MPDSENDLDFAADPNCPECLERMQLVVGAWWCAACRIAVGPGHDEDAPRPTL